MRAFLTGSRVYGIPTEESDVDLVVFMSPPDMISLACFADLIGGGDEHDKSKQSDAGPLGATLRFGKLNIIVTTDEPGYHAWAAGTEELKAVGSPVTRGMAIEVFKRLRVEANKERNTKKTKEVSNE